MPLLARPGESGSGPVTPPISGPTSVPMSVSYVDPDGTEWQWSDEDTGIIVTSVTGLGNPPVSMSQIDLPSGGALAQGYLAQPRSIVVGLYVFDDEQAKFLDLIDRVARSLWTQRAGKPAPGTLVLHRPDGTHRQIDVLCTSGAEQTDEDESQNAYQNWTTFALTFAGLDPFFVDAIPTHLGFGLPGTDVGIPPLLPIKLGVSTVLGDVTIRNNGDADAYPTWTIHGPGTPTIRNNTTGRSFGLASALVTHEVVTVDTRPTRQSAIDGDGNDRWSDLVKADPRDLWPLVPGVNHMSLEVLGSDAGSRVDLSYTRRWLRA